MGRLLARKRPQLQKTHQRLKSGLTASRLFSLRVQILWRRVVLNFLQAYMTGALHSMNLSVPRDYTYKILILRNRLVKSTATTQKD
ncbi:hypothetical protein FOQG_08134 [Fusarium oxysporum f. sp. raphani 54005]|uniref:Uncharacterized protein n=1 Tax=Fusarium oxysporum f. sp. raphani 54005 TaxID=1089458 RepID=X0C371_FUSOX|nr:hypothetical protein FOQG_08134 [Fusarium oxysporum f. sp. raphani 54005]